MIAFEPESSNYYSLNRNIVVNKLLDAVTGLCMGFDSTLKMEIFFYLLQFRVQQRIQLENLKVKGLSSLRNMFREY